MRVNSGVTYFFPLKNLISSKREFQDFLKAAPFRNSVASKGTSAKVGGGQSPVF